MQTRRDLLATLAAASMALRVNAAGLSNNWPQTSPGQFRSAKSGPWSSAATWEGGQVPTSGSVVQILPGHRVIYDVQSERAIRMVHVLGRLSFARDRDTRLDVGLLKIGGDPAEDGANCILHAHSPEAALEVGTPDGPIPAKHTALIRLVYFEGFDRDSLPSLVCCGGRMDLHGAPMGPTWVKLGAPVKKGDSQVRLNEAVIGWRPGDRIILTATVRQVIPQGTFRESVRDNTQTEERIIREINGSTITLDQPAAFDHKCDGLYRGDIANLSRNVTIESADANGVRGHTMYHRNSAGSISYAEFRRLGKRGTLGRYSVHFHLVRDTMRGSSVIGASIWESDNRWITVHGTDYLVVRDCVGYNSIGNGFFLEDGTEEFNIFDRNIAVQARSGKPLPNQVLPFDHNSGAGFWWANSLNSFTRNVACECDVYGFRFDMQKTQDFDSDLSVPQPDGSRHRVDVRTLAFIQFEGNESHCQRNHAFNLGGLSISLDGGPDGVGPDVRHPFVIRDMRVWNSHWSFHTLTPSVMVDGYDIHDCAYGIWRPRFVNHAYRHMHMEKISNHVIFQATGQVPKDLPWERESPRAELATNNIGPRDIFDLELPNSRLPVPLDPVDDLPPVVIATHLAATSDGQTTVRGSATDVGTITNIQINGHGAHAIRPNFAEWEVTLPATVQVLTLRANDAAGNVNSIALAMPTMASSGERHRKKSGDRDQE